jgi:hypothetical protein|tara:strand:- start:714 stop:929 length:216 start_codon:yes stop_codon:yes gene_type:complete
MRVMEVNKKYVIYELNNIMDSERQKSLEKVVFDGFESNSFDTEDEAIDVLIRDQKVYQDFVILREVYITDY